MIQILAAAAPGTEDTAFRLSDILRALAGSLEIPVIAVLIICAASAVLLLGWTIAEYFTERRHLKARLPELLEAIREDKVPTEECIQASGLLKSQKAALAELLAHPDFSPEMREALAVRLIEEQQMKYDRTVRLSELVSRLGPMFGLLGTLIPLGPGIIALGQGDTFTLSNSLLVAFDTTIVGLISAAVATVISTVRRAWYKNYMSVLETVAESILDKEKK
ncbi:MAG: MotA/TolQ/ExbB proton channel family protein [Oscillospiraceae bacterium]|jgi:biopolymer transport protein ExbB/TolQ|nr:MotA/TolQ/ExbB proton channel family protein [Oscillospiraceae bacterium]